MRKKNSRQYFNFLKTHYSSSAGFSLIEILVALFLVTLMFSFVSNLNFSQRQNIEESIENFERAIRFSVDEAAIRNVMIRIHFFLDKSPQEYSLEYGPDDNFVLPNKKFPPVQNRSLKEQEQFENQIKTTSKNFKRVSEFESKNKKIPNGIKIMGIGNYLDQTLTTQFESSIYIYPTGEKDHSLIIIASEREVVSLSIDPFTLEMKRNYQEIPDGDGDDLEERQIELAEDVFTKWLKEI